MAWTGRGRLGYISEIGLFAVDSFGDLYVAEVTYSFAGRPGLVPPDCHTFQKFVRQ